MAQVNGFPSELRLKEEGEEQDEERKVSSEAITDQFLHSGGLPSSSSFSSSSSISSSSSCFEPLSWGSARSGLCSETESEIDVDEVNSVPPSQTDIPLLRERHCKEDTMYLNPHIKWTNDKHNAYLNCVEATFVRKMFGREYCSIELCGENPESTGTSGHH